MYRIRETGAIVSKDELLALYPNTSFPEVITPEIIDSLGADPVLETPAPATTTYQSAQKDGVSQDAQGNWVWDWKIVDWPQDQIDAYDNQQKEANKTTAMGLLTETDWTQMPDVNLVNKADFTAYRAALRAIAVTPRVLVSEWPEKPEEVWS